MSSRLDQERESLLQDKRISSTKKKLLSIGCDIASGPDRTGFCIILRNKKEILFWPYSGWFSGKGGIQGRGFNNLIKRIMQEGEKDVKSNMR